MDCWCVCVCVCVLCVCVCVCVCMCVYVCVHVCMPWSTQMSRRNILYTLNQQFGGMSWFFGVFFFAFFSPVSNLVSPQGHSSGPPATLTFTCVGSWRSSEMSSWMSRRDLRPGVSISPPKHWVMAKKSYFWDSSARETSSPPSDNPLRFHLIVKTTIWKKLHSHWPSLFMLEQLILKEQSDIFEYAYMLWNMLICILFVRWQDQCYCHVCMLSM